MAIRYKSTRFQELGDIETIRTLNGNMTDHIIKILSSSGIWSFVLIVQEHWVK